MSKNIQVPQGWEVKKLGEVVEKITQKNTINCDNILTISAQYGLINQKDFFNKKIASNDISGYYLINKNDFAYNKSYSIDYPYGAIKRLTLYNNGVVSTLYICFRFIEKNIDIVFMEQYFETQLFNKYIYSVAQEGARNHGLLNITNYDFFNMPILLPPLEEQKKIAEILSLWDKAIEQTKELIAYKEKQKKGLMQALLTGKKRLQGFTDEWKTYKLGEVVDKEIIYKKGQPLTAENANNGIIPVIAAGREIPYFHDNYNFQNIITISASGAYAGYVWYHNYPIWASDCNVLYGKIDVFDTIFLFYILKLQQNRLYSLQTGGAQPHIYKNDICQLFIPKISFCEQKAIADILSKADEEIELLNKQLELYTEQKKGLMQNLLTGKVRV